MLSNIILSIFLGTSIPNVTLIEDINPIPMPDEVKNHLCPVPMDINSYIQNGYKVILVWVNPYKVENNVYLYSEDTGVIVHVVQTLKDGKLALTCISELGTIPPTINKSTMQPSTPEQKNSL